MALQGEGKFGTQWLIVGVMKGITKQCYILNILTLSLLLLEKGSFFFFFDLRTF